MKRKQKTTAEVQAAIFRREHRKSPLRGGVKMTLKKAREWINNYPREILGWKTSAMCFRECLDAL